MNKQEAIEEIEKEKSNLNAWEDLTRNRALNDALAIVRKIYEPEKSIVPQFVAEWLEVCKENLAISLAGSMNPNVLRINNQSEKTIHWLAENQETFAKAWIYGYEAEKEKLYTVEIPNPNGGTYLALCKDVNGKLFFDVFFSEEWKTFGKCKLTEAEIKEDFDWAWQFAKEMKR